MTQDPQNPEAPKTQPTSAWAPRSDPSPAVPTSDSPAPEQTEAAAPTPEPAAETPVAEPVTPVSPAPEAKTVVMAAPPAPPPAKRSGVPAWLLVVAAIVPALIVGLVVFFVAGSSSEEDDSTAAAGVIDGLMRLGQPNQSNITSYAGTLPPEFGTDFPIYTGAQIVVSIAMASQQGTGYLIVLSTPDDAGEVFAFYNDALDQDPWQVEIGRSSREFTGLRFLRVDNIDVSGDVSLHRSSLDEQTVIYLSYTDISQAILPGGATNPFTAGMTRALPAGFPEDVPIYAGTEDSIVLDTYFERGQGGRAFIVTFLTTDSQRDVIEYYREEFEGRGWVVSDAGVASTSFALGIEFDDGATQTLSGTITADTYEDDPDYTQVDLIVTTRAGRN